jgi:hypothetical protein
MEYQIRNWLYFDWLSGDHICEQAVHSLDKTGWLQGDIAPVKAFGMGGRQQRTGREYGNIYDHHTVFYEYPNNVRVYFTCRQQTETSNFVDEIVLGTKGQAQIIANRITGENPWQPERGPNPDMLTLEHVAFFKSIRDGKPINNGHYMANSTMLAVMGRMCTYTGKELTWEQAFNSKERLGPTTYSWTDDVPPVNVAIPGKYQLA